MAGEFAFYADLGLSQKLSGITVTQASDGSSAAEDRVVYLGSTLSGKSYQAAINPGVDPVQVSIVDSAAGTGVEAAHVKLATTQAGLDQAIAGAPVDLGVTIEAGTGLPVWVRVETPALAAGVYAEVALSSGTVREVSA